MLFLLPILLIVLIELPLHVLIFVCLLFCLNRQLSVERNGLLYIRLFPEPSPASKEQSPIAKFILRVYSAGANPRTHASPGMIL